MTLSHKNCSTWAGKLIASNVGGYSSLDNKGVSTLAGGKTLGPIYAWASTVTRQLRLAGSIEAAETLASRTVTVLAALT